jgi:hypothetical protein
MEANECMRLEHFTGMCDGKVEIGDGDYRRDDGGGDYRRDDGGGDYRR